MGSDFLFDFDRSELRHEAAPALDELANHIARTEKIALIEGHTDSRGTDVYNQDLSLRRADSVRAALEARGLSRGFLDTRGFGKTKPVVPNEHLDGSDDQEGRRKNRRVEVVINTCR